MSTTITLSGFKEFEAKCKSMPDILLKELDGEVEDATRVWAGLAKEDAPKDQGFLAGRISNKKISLGEWETVSEAEYSAFQEWGTKTRVSVPVEFQSYALEFKKSGSGDAKKMIYAWMNRVGIPAQFQWIVFFSIITKGIHPHPFFFIQKPIVEKQFITNAQKILNTEH